MKNECRKFCAYFCLKALAFGVIIQLIFLAIFVAFVNFNIFHPYQWILALFGFHWLKHVFLIGVFLINGLFLSKYLIAERNYYPSRFKWLLANGPRKLILLSTEVLFALLTSWAFISYLPIQESSFLIEKNGKTVLNSHYTFMSVIGVFGGLYHFLGNNARQDIVLHFDYIPKPTHIRLRESIIRCSWYSLKHTFIPTLCFASFYWICGGLVNRRLASFFSVSLDNDLNNLLDIFSNFKLLIFAWLIVAEIFCMMRLIVDAFSIFMTSNCAFPIGDSTSNIEQITLVTALSMTDVPIIQKIAALDFYNLTKMKCTQRRGEIFALSKLGGHPYNWNQLSAQCLSIINNFADELSAATKSLPPIVQQMTPRSIYKGIQPNVTELAQRILIRQYNEMHNIRHLKTEMHPIEQNITQQISTVARINANFEKTIDELKQRVLRFFQELPGLYFMFGEPEGLKITFLLSNSDLIIWIIQGLSYICSASIIEDPYGVVQLTLPEIMKAFLKLKAELDKLPSINMNCKKIDPNLLLLKNALKRSLHKVCNSFADFLPEIVEDVKDLPFLGTFLYQSSSYQ